MVVLDPRLVDDLGYIAAVSKLLSDDHTPAMKDNVDLWRRVKHRLNSKQKNILITWIKEHATDKDTELGRSSALHQIGNDAADKLANAGSRKDSHA